MAGKTEEAAKEAAATPPVASAQPKVDVFEDDDEFEEFENEGEREIPMGVQVVLLIFWAPVRSVDLSSDPSLPVHYILELAKAEGCTNDNYDRHALLLIGMTVA